MNTVNFRSFAVTEASGEAPAAGTRTRRPPPRPPSPPRRRRSAEHDRPRSPPRPARRRLPIGATVGPAGLPVTPYDLKYFGEFFDMADFFASLDERVEVTKAERQGARRSTGA